MANRTVLGELPGSGFGLRISRPGYNVLSTSIPPKRLAFDSSWIRALSIAEAGTMLVEVSAPGALTKSLYFAKTYAAPPPCILWREAGGVIKPFIISTNTGSWWFDTASPPVRIFNNRIQVVRNAIEEFTLRYIVLEGN